MEKYMTDDRSQRARAAAEAGTVTRDRQIEKALRAYFYDLDLATLAMPLTRDRVTARKMLDCQIALRACLAHLDEIERHLLMIDEEGMKMYDLSQSIGPDVALKGWGSKR
jgi:hypothetical protein